MTQAPRPPLETETEVALGALGLLSFQSLREFYLFSFSSKGGLFAAASGLALIVLYILIRGLLKRS